MKSRVFIFLMIFGLATLFSGCAGSKIYLMDLRYTSEKKPPPSSALQKAKVVGLCPFVDARKEKDKDLIGVRHRHDKSVDLLKVEGGNLSETVTKAVRKYFTEQGFKVTDCKGWDKSPEGLSRLPDDLLLVVAGRIELFYVEAHSSLMTTEMYYRVRLVASIGQIEKNQVITRKVERSPETERVGFDPDKVQARLNTILTDVIQDLFRDSY